MTQPTSAKIAVLIPCFNEALTIAKVVADFRQQLPDAMIYVFDNNSTDDTHVLARRAGAIVTKEKRQGKGNVVASMFRLIEADIYVMVDGDDTYPAEAVHALIEPLVAEQADMTVGTRLTEYRGDSFRPLHVFGNRLIVRTINGIFGAKLVDVLSGYRGFSRTFVKQIPLVSKGFEIETELTLQALHRGMVIKETPVSYRGRPPGSVSKLSTFRDGIRVFVKIFDIMKAYRPLLFFSLFAGICFLLAGVFGLRPILDIIRDGATSHVLSALGAATALISGLVLLVCGLILDIIKHHFRELAQLVLKSRSD